jgi:hypothetical protein
MLIHSALINCTGRRGREEISHVQIFVRSQPESSPDHAAVVFATLEIAFGDHAGHEDGSHVVERHHRCVVLPANPRHGISAGHIFIPCIGIRRVRCALVRLQLGGVRRFAALDKQRRGAPLEGRRPLQIFNQLCAK